jgi:hypothetical protein
MKRKGDTKAKPTKKAKLQPKRVTRKQQEDIEYEKDEISLEEESAAEENARKSTKKVAAAQKKTNKENDKEEEEISDYDEEEIKKNAQNSTKKVYCYNVHSQSKMTNYSLLLEEMKL